MNISIASVFKELYEPFLNTSLVKRAQENGIVSIKTVSFFDMVAPKERIDAPTFGPGAGMLIKPTVVQKTIEALQHNYGKAYKIFFSPHGTQLTQPLLHKITQQAQKQGHLMLIAGRYEGMDARVEQYYADEIISIGDFVLMGGDLPAMIFLEGMLRLMPGVVGKEESIRQESFSGPFVDYPEYTEPVEWQNMKVPDIVRSGNHEAIQTWRLQQAVQRTVKQHFSWLRSVSLNTTQKKLVAQSIPPHYVVLMHSEVLLAPGKVGTSSVMSIDIHDIARSSTTYGIAQFFVVTPLKDQQKIVQHFLSFWQEAIGEQYNKNRHQALEQVSLAQSLEQVIAAIKEREGKDPLLLATSARSIEGKSSLTYDDQGHIWQQNRPVLIIFGTAKGLADTVLQRSDYILNPIHGLSDFNHLSVRSAVGIVLDRWIGLNECLSEKLPE